MTFYDINDQMLKFVNFYICTQKEF